MWGVTRSVSERKGGDIREEVDAAANLQALLGRRMKRLIHSPVTGLVGNLTLCCMRTIGESAMLLCSICKMTPCKPKFTLVA
jgi:hypothetical protein